MHGGDCWCPRQCRDSLKLACLTLLPPPTHAHACSRPSPQSPLAPLLSQARREATADAANAALLRWHAPPPDSSSSSGEPPQVSC